MKKKVKKKKKKLIKVAAASKNNVRLIDIAKRVGVSTSTVSRILSGSPNSVKFTSKTKSKILKVASELGYASFRIPIKYHRDVRSVMVVNFDPSETFYQKIISYIEKTLRAKGYACYFSYTDSDSHQASEKIDAMGKRFISGCVIFQERKEFFTTKNKIKLENLGIPCVLVDHHPDPLPSFISTIELDNVLAGYDVMSHLLHLGHRHFALFTAPGSSTPPARRLGIEKRLNKIGLTLDPEYVVEIQYDARFKLIDNFKKWASSKKGFPTAIITAYDLIGYEVLNALESKGISVPEDVSIASFDDRVEMIPWGLDNVRVPLTSVHQPIESIGVIAANELIARMNEPSREPEHIRLKGELMIRSSTTKPCEKKIKI